METWEFRQPGVSVMATIKAHDMAAIIIRITLTVPSLQLYISQERLLQYIFNWPTDSSPPAAALTSSVWSCCYRLPRVTRAISTAIST
jgi:hypothetical protein